MCHTIFIALGTQKLYLYSKRGLSLHTSLHIGHTKIIKAGLSLHTSLRGSQKNYKSGGLAYTQTIALVTQKL